MSKQRKPIPAHSPNHLAAKAATEKRAMVADSPILPFFQNTLLQCGLIFAFAFVLYANTLWHGFVLDDAIVITDNMYTQKGVEGIGGILSKDTFFGFFKVEGKETLVSGGRYRPLTLVLFAFVYQVAGASPFLFHLITVLLFGLTCVALYRTLLLLLSPPAQNNSAQKPVWVTYGPMIAWIATLLFAAHPIHTEVVANIKGCDEILTLLGCMGALFFTLKSWDTGQSKWAILAGITFFLACLSKENAAAFLFLIPLALWFFRANGPSAAKGTKSQETDVNTGKLLRTSLPVLIAFVIFFLLRGSILHWRFGGEPMELMNNPFLKFDGTKWVKFAPAERFATIFYTLWKYVQLLFWPHPLTHDYYPRQIATMSFSKPVVLLSLALYGSMAYWAVRGMLRREPVAFGILLYLLPLGIVSNLIFPIGTNMGERFAFMPSVGFCFLAAYFLVKYFNQKTTLLLGIAGGIALVFGVMTLLRNPVWASNERLFMTDAAVSTESAKIQNACGGVLFDRATKEKDAEKQKALCQEALPHLNKALEIYPNYKDAYISRGGAHYVLRNYEASIADYRRAVQLAEGDEKMKTYLAQALRDGGKYYGEQKGDLAKALKYISEAWQLNPKDAECARLLGVVNGVQGKHTDAISWFLKATELSPKEASYFWDLGMAYTVAGNAPKGEEMRQKALTLDPDIAQKRGGGKK